MKKLISILLVAVMLLGTAACQTTVQPASSQPEQPASVSEAVSEVSSQPEAPAEPVDLPLTREQASEIIFAAAAKYNTGITAEAVTQGLPENGGTATRAEALVMLSNAFGELPKPGADWERITTDAKYTDVPDWAASAFDSLYAGRLLAPGEDSLLKGDETITAKELDTYLQRVYTLYRTRLEDDFYHTVNKEWLDTHDGIDMTMEPEYQKYSVSGEEVRERINERLDVILDDILKGNWDKGTPERKVADMYNTLVDKNSRAKAGTVPLEACLEALDGVSSLKDFEAALVKLDAEAACLPYFSIGFMQNLRDGTEMLPIESL